MPSDLGIGAANGTAPESPGHAATFNVLDKLRQGLCVFDSAHRLQVFNRRYAEMYDLDPADLHVGMTLRDIVDLRCAAGTGPAMSHDEFMVLRDDVVSRKRVMDSFVRLRDGRVHEIHHEPTPDGGWVATFDDVTERVRAEEALREKTALLDATLENIDQGLLLIDPQGVVQVHNKRALELLDLADDFMQARPTMDDVRILQTARGEFTRSAGPGQRWQPSNGRGLEGGRYERERPNGTILEVCTVPLADGSAVRTFTDITVRKRAEIALSESEERLRALTDALPQLVWVARADDGIITYANHRFRDYLGPIGPTRRDRIAAHHPEDRERAAAGWASAEQSGQMFEIEARWLRFDGVYRWHKLILTPVRHEGVITEWLGTALDIDDIVADRESLREKTELLELSQEAAGAGLFDWDLVAGSARLSLESLRLFNLPEDRTTDIAGDEWASIVHPDDIGAVFREAERATATGTTYRVEFRIPCGDAPDRWILGVGRIIGNSAGRPARMVGLNLDITERKHSEDTLRRSEERLMLALDSGSDGLWDWTVSTGEVWYSDRWTAMLGYAPGELEGHIRTWERLIHPEDRDRALALTAAHFQGRSPAYECEHRLRHKDGGWGWVLARGKVVSRDAEGAPTRVVGTHVDIGARKAAEGRIEHMARHDGLTDLPNRTLFRERLDQRLAEIDRYGGSCAVLYMDLDRFKGVNDTLGHLAGDALLRETARRLRSALRIEDTVARLGGDEFAVLIGTDGRIESTAALADRLIALVGEPVMFGAQRVEVGLSIGIALAPEHGLDSEAMFKRADLALYRAKADGRNIARFFEAAMDEEAAERRRLESDLQRAIGGGELVLHYQPQVKGGTGELVGFEALVRWQHPTHGLVPPSRFIPLAEESGLIVSLGEWVLRTACREAASWGRPMKVAVNLSPRQFQQADLPEVVLSILAETGLSPARLELEITESVIINDMERALAILRRLKDLGIRIAMDDFGTGYSSLATLQAFPFDKIKIDRTFVGQVEDSAQAAVIVRAVLGLGRSLGMGVVAEGVETLSQLQFLADEACEELQGYYFGQPQPIEQFSALLFPDGARPFAEEPDAVAVSTARLRPAQRQRARAG